MLEEISRAISTALFFLCTAIVGGLEPSPPSPADIPVAAVAETDTNEVFSIVGKWNSGGRVFDFTESGKLLYGERVFEYTQNGDTVTVLANVNGKRREYTVSLNVLGERVVKLNGVTLYKTD